MINEPFIEQVSKKRQIIELSVGQEDVKLTIFLGIFNAEEFIDSLAHQLQSQKSKKADLLIVDNCSFDSSWEKINNAIWGDWNSVTLIRNPINLGAAGTLNMSVGLVKTKWFTAIHQDDFYFDSHISTLLEEINSSDSDIIAISTQMGSLSDSYKIKRTPVRANWILPNSDQVTALLANIECHTLPWPATAFRKREFVACLSNWHSGTFADTEILLSLSSYGKFKFSKQQTMLYRENSKSESHVLNQKEKRVGSSLGLIRYFSSQDFKKLWNLIPYSYQINFLVALKSAIQKRLGDLDLAFFVYLFALERIIQFSGYSNLESLKALQTEYSSLEAGLTSELLGRICTFLNQETENNNINYQSILNSNNPIRINKFKIKIFGLFNLGFIKLAYVKSWQLRNWMQKNNKWNFTWTSRN